MARLPGIEFSQEQANVSQFRGQSPAAAAAPFEAVSRTAFNVTENIRASRIREAETKAMEDNSSLQVEMLEKQEEIQKEFADSPDGYTRRVKEELDNTLNTALEDTDDSFYQQALKERFSRSKTTFLNSAIKFEAEQKTKVQTNRLNQSVSNLALSIDQNPAFLPNAIKEIKENFTIAQEVALIENAEGKQSEAISKLYGAAVDHYVNRQDLEGAKKLIKDERFQERLGYERVVKASRNIQKLEDKLEKENKKANEARNKIQLAESVLATNIPVDAFNKNTQDVFDTYYENSEMSSGLVNMDKESVQLLQNLAERTKYIPEMAVSTLRSQLYTGSDAQKLFALDSISRLEETSGIAVEAFPQRDRSIAAFGTKLLRAGLEPTEVIKTIGTRTDTTNDPLMKQRETEYREVLKENSPDDIAEEAIKSSNFWESLFTNDPELSSFIKVRDQARQDVTAIFKNAYMTHGDVDVARETTRKQFQRFYGGFRGEIMKYPPSNFYEVYEDPDKNDEWIFKEAIQDAKNFYPDANDDNVRLYADSITAREARKGNEVSYQLLYIDNKTGAAKEMRGEDGRLKRFVPNAAPEIKKLRDQREKALGIASTAQEAREIISEEERALGSYLELRGGF